MKTARIYLKLILVLMIVASGFLLSVSSAFCQSRHIRFATVKWEPYWGPNLSNSGYLTEITSTALYRVGYTMQIDFVPWKRALHDVKNGHYDALFGSYYVSGRLEWLIYTDPIDEAQMVFFAKKGKKIKWKSLRDLKGYTIGVQQEYKYTDEFDNAAYLQKEAVRKMDLNLKKLVENRIDLVVASRKVFLFLAQSKYPNALGKIEVVPRALKTNAIYHGFSKKDPEHLRYAEDFNRGLLAIKADGTFDAIMKKHGFK